MKRMRADFIFTMIVAIGILPLFARGADIAVPSLFVGFTAGELKTGIAEVNGTKLYYEIAGSGDPLVLIHGWSFDTRCWDDQFSDFSRSYRVLRYDLRGFGKSSLPKPGITYSHTEDLAALLDFLRIERVHILGHSFGGKIAIDFALNHPERTISLILADAGMDVIGITPSDEIVRWIGDTWKAGRESGIDKAKEIWINGSPFAPAMKNPKSAKKVRQMIDDYSGWQWGNDDPYVGIPPFPPERLSEIKVPTLILVGELDPPDYHLMADIQKKYILGAKKMMISGAGHALNIECPEEFNRIVLRFLEGVSKRK